MEEQDIVISSFLHIETIAVQVVQQSNPQLCLPTNGIFTISQLGPNGTEGENDNENENEFHDDDIPFLLLEVFVEDEEKVIDHGKLYHRLLTVNQIRDEVSNFPKATQDLVGNEKKLISNPIVNQLLSLLQINSGSKNPTKSDNISENKEESKSTTTANTKLLDDGQEIRIRFELQVDDNMNDEDQTQSMAIQVSHRLKSGIVLSPWSTRLTPSSRTTVRSRGTSSSSSLPSTISTFIRRLVINHFSINSRLRAQAEESCKLETARDAWKDTATKLEQQYWQEEKNELLQNFLKLYEAKHTLMQRQNDTIEQLQKQIQLLEERLSTNNDDNQFSASAKQSVARNNKSEMENIPDDYDNEEDEVYKPELVAALAAGRKISTAAKSRKTTVAKKAVVTATRKRSTQTSDDNDQGLRKVTTKRKRKTETTDAIESKEEILLQNNSKNLQSKNKLSKPPTTRNVKKEVHSDSSTPTPPTATDDKVDDANLKQVPKRIKRVFDSDTDSTSTDGGKRQSKTTSEVPPVCGKSQSVIATSNSSNPPLNNDNGSSNNLGKANNDLTGKVIKKLSSSDDSSDTDDDMEQTRNFFKLKSMQQTNPQHQNSPQVDTEVATSSLSTKEEHNSLINKKKTTSSSLDSDRIDQDLHDDILAQLEAMKN